MKLKEVLENLEGGPCVLIYIGSQFDPEISLEPPKDRRRVAAGEWYVTAVTDILNIKKLSKADNENPDENPDESPDEKMMVLDAEVTGIMPYLHILKEVQELCNRYPGLEPSTYPGIAITVQAE